MNFLKLSLNVLYKALLSKKNQTEMIGHHVRLRDGMGHLTALMPVLVLIRRIIHRSTFNFAEARSTVY